MGLINNSQNIPRAAARQEADAARSLLGTEGGSNNRWRRRASIVHINFVGSTRPSRHNIHQPLSFTVRPSGAPPPSLLRLLRRRGVTLLSEHVMAHAPLLAASVVEQLRAGQVEEPPVAAAAGGEVGSGGRGGGVFRGSPLLRGMCHFGW